MSQHTTHGIREWIRKQAATPAPVRDLSGENAAAYAAECLAFFSDDDDDDRSNEPLDAALRNIAVNLGEVLYYGTDAAAELAVVLAAAAWLTRAFASRSDNHVPLFGFWDSVLTNFIDRVLWSEHPLLQEACFAALLSQLTSPNRYCQLSALHGLNHLRHPRTHVAIDWFLSRAADSELREYAGLARRFEAM